MVNSILGFILFWAGGVVITVLLMPTLTKMMTQAGFVRPNFENEKVPLGTGVIFLLSTQLLVLTGTLFGINRNNSFQYLLIITIAGFLGFMDDALGTRHATGLSGHLKKLVFGGELTTGAIKALGIGFISLVTAVQLNRGMGIYFWFDVLVDTLTIALSTNMVNLLDLRPGRAGKGFLVVAGFILTLGNGHPEAVYLAIMAGSVAAYMPEDLQRKTMMGDTGSNILGAALGYTAIFLLPSSAKIFYLTLLILFHALTEKYSLTKIIQNNRMLNYLDMLGRK